jgi:Domain of unknown function (DUF4173)
MNTIMPKNPRTTAVIILLAAVSFDQLFWHQRLGVNLSLFSVITLVILGADAGWRSFSRPAKASGLGTLIAALAMMWHGSTIAMIAACTTLAICSAFVLAPSLRSVPIALCQWAGNALASPVDTFGMLSDVLPGAGAARKGWWWIRITLLPALILILFFLLYRGGNSRFDGMTAGFLTGLGDLFSRFFTEILTPHTLFFLGMLLLAVSLLWSAKVDGLSLQEDGFTDGLERVRSKRAHWLPPLGLGALDRERRVAIILLVLVNALLLVVNMIDIRWMWFGFTMEPGMSLKEFVHEGTWLLIISILLSMGILLHQFRGNLNFHPKNRALIVLASAWLVQNFILGISVFLRNYHYIHFHGLAYKRIGVIVFLVLMLVGLVTLYIKINRCKSFFYLTRVNGWAAFAMLVCLSTVDWDSQIVRYNLAHWNQGEIDVDNYLAMSDKVLPLLFTDVDRVRQQMQKHRENEVRWVRQLDPNAFAMDLEGRKAAFMQRYTTQSWKSWTWSDQRTYAALLQLDNTLH